MTRVTILLCALALTAAAAAQTVRPIKVTPVQAAPAPVEQATQVSPAVEDAARTTGQESAPRPIDTVESLRAANNKLRADNRTLRAENNDLKQQILGYTRHGGSLVTAYCPTATLSRNTAGDERDCAAGGYKCEKVSGLCHATCSTSAECATGYSCNPCNNKCENNAGPITQCG
jgi:hypothetical protein